MKAPANYLVIKFEKSRDDTFTTESGMTFYVPTMKVDENDPKTETDVDAIRTYGEVVATPWKLTKSIMIPVVVKEGNKEKMRTAADIVPEVEVGDIIHFRYTAMDNLENRVINEDGIFQLIPYPDVFAYERDGEVFPVGSYVFLEPIYDKIVESDKLIIPDDINKKKTEKARVKWIGTPFKDESPINVNQGDVVVYNTRLAERQKVNDTWYEVVYQDDILMVVEDEVTC